MKHKPSGFLGDAKSAVNFVGRDAILAANQHPKGWEPLLQRDRGILKDRSNLDRELATAVTALPPLLRLEIVGIFGILSPTVWTPGAIWPAHSGNSINANLFIAKELDGFLECFWAFHAKNISNWRGFVKLINSFKRKFLRNH
jgi:hypothetical protein